MKKSITIATRESKLALWQAHFIRDELKALYPELEVGLLGMTTKGDQWLAAPLSEVGGKGLFVKELEVAMLDGRADIAVHCVKDLPAQLPSGFSLPVTGFRADVRDVLVISDNLAAKDLAGLPKGAKVGSSSLRRKTQLLKARPDLDVQPIRGNVGTRLDKLDSGEFDAIVLAAAGLDRLGIQRNNTYALSIQESLPAPGQGALAIECREAPDLIELLAPMRDVEVTRCVEAERGISVGMGADCSLPIAAYAQLDDEGNISLQAMVGNDDGTKLVYAEVSGSDPAVVADQAVAKLDEQGAQAILDSLRNRSKAQ